MGQVKGCDDMNWFRRMMYGRYGNDQFGNFLFVVYLLLFVLQRIFIRTVAAPVFALVSMLVIVLILMILAFVSDRKGAKQNEKIA